MAIAVAASTGTRRAPTIPAPGYRWTFSEVTFTGTYPTGGEALDPKVFGLKRIVQVLGNATEAAGRTTMWNVHWDEVNAKLKLMGLAVGATGMTEHGNIAYAAVSVGHLIVIGVPA